MALVENQWHQKSTLFYLIVFFCLLSCTKKHLTIQDLDLSIVSEIRKDRATNNIKKTYYISDNSKKAVEQKTYAYVEYDSLGRRIGSYLYPPYHNTKKWFYDSLGLIKQLVIETNEAQTYNATYSFNLETHILYQYWSGNNNDTFLYYFNNNGILTKSVICEDIGNGAFCYINKYTYDSEGKLNNVFSTQIESLQDTAISNKNLEELNTINRKYYYTDNHLDSTIESFRFVSGSHFTKTETFDNNGLPIGCVNDDGYMVRFKHEKR